MPSKPPSLDSAGSSERLREVRMAHLAPTSVGLSIPFVPSRILSTSLAASLVIPAALTGCEPNGAATDTPETLELRQGVFTAGDYPLQVEWRDEPRVLELRRRERLDEVIAGA